MPMQSIQSQGQRPGTSGISLRQGGVSSSQALSLNNSGTVQGNGPIHNKHNSNIFKKTSNNNEDGQYVSRGQQSKVNLNQKNTQGNGQVDQNLFYQMNNNFMVINGQNQTNVQSGVGSVANGQKTAYGFVGGISGQGLVSGIGSNNQTLQQKNRNASSKKNLNGLAQMNPNSTNQNFNNGQVMNKRVFSANRVSSLNSGGGQNHHTQQVSMQQRRRQQAAYQNGQNANKGVNYQNLVNQAALSHGSASSAHFQGGGNPLSTSQNFNRGSLAKKNTGGAIIQVGNNQKYQDDEGFMRGARIAEKIQEYYHSNQNPAPGGTMSNFHQASKQNSMYAQNAGNGSSIKQYGGGKQLRTTKNGVFQINNNRTGNSQSYARQTHTSHGTGSIRGAQSQAVQQSKQNQNSGQTQENVAMKGRASSSYGSLQSRTNNVVVSQSSIINQQQQMANLNKSGISATSGILNQSKFYSAGTGNQTGYYQDSTVQITQGTFDRIVTIGSQANLNSAQGATNDSTKSQTGKDPASVQRQPQGASSMRPISRDVKLRSQAARNNHSGQITQNQNLPLQNQGSALSSTKDEKLNSNGTLTFQNTINIGSFINEINHQQMVAGSNNRPMGITTFSNTIEGVGNTDESGASKDKDNQSKGDEIQNQDRQMTNGTRLNSIMNTGTQGSIENLKCEQIAGGPAGQQFQSSNQNDGIVTGNNFNTMNGTVTSVTSGGLGPNQSAQAKVNSSTVVPGAYYSAPPGQNQNSVKIGPKQGGNTMYIQDGQSDEPVIKIYNQNTKSSTAAPNVPQDARQIKLNYIQLNKRATTASNYQGLGGRKIPQKNGAQGQQTEYQNMNKQNGQGNKSQSNLQQTQKGTYGNVYQDTTQNDLRNTTQNFNYNTQNNTIGAYDNQSQGTFNSNNIQNQYRQLQNRQTRRIITAGHQDQKEQQDPTQLGKGQSYVQQHIQQQQIQNQTAHMAQTHALAYQVEKYKEGNDQQEITHQTSQDQQNQFCTDASNIENIDNYIIGKRIGQGAYAVVRVGLHKLLNQKIAVKIYEKFKLLEPNRRKSVKREIKIMEKIDHECLAKLYEAFESHKQVFLIMEYVNGGSLHGYLKGKPNRQMAEIEAKFLWQQVVFGIHYLHQRNVTHRDIKLENILLDETRTRVKLIDFGFSTCIPHEKKVKIFCGTPSYMAPEIVSKIEYAGPPADIWALGVLLYALLCGRFPFKGSNDKELYTNICKQDLPLADHISRQGKQLLLKIFHKNPDKRPSTKDILRDPWLQFSPRDQEMMSPKSLSFIHYLKKISNINFGNQNQNKIGLNKTISGFGRGINESMDVTASSFQIQSKDKRHQLHASDVKQFIIDENTRKNMIQKKQMQSIGSDIGAGSFCNYNQNQNQSMTATTGPPNNFIINQQPQNGAATNGGSNIAFVDISKQKYNLNDTMPVNGVGGLSSINIIRQSSAENGLQMKNMDQLPTPNTMVSKEGNDIQSDQPKNKINMEAYQAYYNTNESSLAAGQAIPQGLTNMNSNEGQFRNNSGNNIEGEKDQKVDPKENYNPPQEQQQNLKIVNNIMHINHSGANINIMCGNNEQQKEGQQQNNFIFNHTAPINLNFYEEGKKKDSAQINSQVVQASGEQEIINKNHEQIKSPDMQKNQNIQDSDNEAEEVIPRSSNKKVAVEN